MRILIAYDGSPHADAAIEDMRRAGLPPQGNALVLFVAHDATESEMANGDSMACYAANQVQSVLPQWTVSAEVLCGPPGKIILEHCASWRPDLLIAGSHGRSAAARFLLGSVSTELIHKAPCSVRVVRLDRSGGIGPIRIIIGHDGSSYAEMAVRAVARRFWPEHTEARVIAAVESLVPTAVTALEESTYASEAAFQVIKDEDAHEWARIRTEVEASMLRLRFAGLMASAVVTEADPAKELVAEAVRTNADAIFIGAHGIGRIERLLMGSVSTAVVTHADCSVEIVRLED